ncbi:MAG: MFS transporter, partial [Planctomycetes bacterium]|nr:MFS transporter [Planctomycetota bacterium]
MVNASPEHDGRSLALFNVQAAMFGMFMSVRYAGGTVMSGYGMDVMGISRENMGLVCAAFFFAGFVQMLSFVVSNRITDKKRFVIGVGSLEAIVIMMALLPPIVLGGAGRAMARQAIFVVLLFAAAACFHLVQPLQSNWLATLMPQQRRGHYLGLRSMIMMACQAATVLGTAAFIKRYPTYNGFACVILAMGAVGVVQYLVLTRAEMPALVTGSNFSLRDIGSGLRHRPFGDYMLFLVVLNIPFAMACAYYSPFLLKEVGLNYAEASYYQTARTLTMLVAIWPFGRLVDKIGSRPLIYLMIAIYICFFLAFPLFTRDRLWLIVGAWGFVGLGDCFWMVALISTLYHSLPAGSARTACLALAQGTMFLMLGLGPIL